MDVLKDCLSLFLQITGVLVLLTTLWTSRHPTLKLGSPVLIFNLDRALRSPVYGTPSGLQQIVEALMGSRALEAGQRYFGLRPPFDGVDVLKAISHWKAFDIYPMSRIDGSDSNERWLGEISRFAHNYKVNLRDDLPSPPSKEVAVQRGALVSLSFELNKQYGYDPLHFLDEERPSNISSRFAPEDIDVWDEVTRQIASHCESPKARAQALWAIGHASKYVNVLEVRNPFHESFNNVHLRISHSNQGMMRLVESVAQKEGFEIINSNSQYAHVVLAELPPNAVRFCVVETATQPITRDAVEVQTGILQRLPPSSIKTIAIVAAILAIGIVVGASVLR